MVPILRRGIRELELNHKYHDLLICLHFSLLLFSKAGFERYLTKGNLLKRTLLNEKQNNLDKEMYGNISLYS